MKTKCGAGSCEDPARVLVHTPIVSRTMKVPRCLRHLSKNDNYEPLEEGR